MYLLSIEGKAAQRVLQSVSKLPSKWQTVYRWGVYWGYLIPDEQSWRAERHEYITHSRDEDDTMYLLEKIESSHHGVPPYIIDDMWKEEIKQNGLCTYGNLLTIRGNKSAIEDVLKTLSISHKLPESIADSSETTTASPPLQETPRLHSQHPLPHRPRQEQLRPPVRGQPHAALRGHIGRPVYGRPQELPSSSLPAAPRTHGVPPRGGGRGGQAQRSREAHPINPHISL